MERESKFSDQYGPEDEEKLGEEMERENKLERELMPYVVAEIRKRIETEGIDEEEIKRISEDLKKVDLSVDEVELRKIAIVNWEQELIDRELEKKVEEEKKKSG